MKKTIPTILAAIALAGTIVGCSSDADVVSDNLSKSADQFELEPEVIIPDVDRP